MRAHAASLISHQGSLFPPLGAHPQNHVTAPLVSVDLRRFTPGKSSSSADGRLEPEPWEKLPVVYEKLRQRQVPFFMQISPWRRRRRRRRRTELDGQPPLPSPQHGVRQVPLVILTRLRAYLTVEIFPPFTMLKIDEKLTETSHSRDPSPRWSSFMCGDLRFQCFTLRKILRETRIC